MALNLYFKPCCIVCDHIDVNVDQSNMYFGIDDVLVKTADVTCSHREVCQYYKDDTSKDITDWDMNKRFEKEE